MPFIDFGLLVGLRLIFCVYVLRLHYAHVCLRLRLLAVAFAFLPLHTHFTTVAFTAFLILHFVLTVVYSVYTRGLRLRSRLRWLFTVYPVLHTVTTRLPGYLHLRLFGSFADSLRLLRFGYHLRYIYLCLRLVGFYRLVAYALVRMRV